MFKSYGEEKGHTDKFLTIAVSIGMVFNFMARLLGGVILDNIEFKYYFSFVLILSSMLGLTYNLVAKN